MTEPDVEGIAGRMRLVQRRIDMAQSEREVDRIDVFERRRKVREVGREKDQGKRGQPAAHGVRPAEA